MHVRTRYFFAGGRARCPLVKDEEYFADAASTFFCMADKDIVVCCFVKGAQIS